MSHIFPVILFKTLFVNQNIDLNICLNLNWDFCEIRILKVGVGVIDFVCVHPK
jgi:hypothetical protein